MLLCLRRQMHSPGTGTLSSLMVAPILILFFWSLVGLLATFAFSLLSKEGICCHSFRVQMSGLVEALNCSRLHYWFTSTSSLGSMFYLHLSCIEGRRRRHHLIKLPCLWRCQVYMMHLLQTFLLVLRRLLLHTCLVLE